MNTTRTASATEIALIPLDQIDAGDNDRKEFDPAEIAALARSIETNGLIQPITVRPIGDKFEIVAGERRYRACVSLGLPAVRAIVEEMTDSHAAFVMLAENTSRVDLNPIEEAAAYQARIDAGFTLAEVAEAGGVSEQRVMSRMALGGLEAEVKVLVASGWLGSRNAGRMIGLTPERQRMALRAVDNKNLTQAQVIEVIDTLHTQQNTEPLFVLSNEAYVVGAIEAAQEAARAAVPVRNALVALLKEAGDALGSAGLAPELVAAIEEVQR